MGKYIDDLVARGVLHKGDETPFEDLSREVTAEEKRVRAIERKVKLKKYVQKSLFNSAKDDDPHGFLKDWPTEGKDWDDYYGSIQDSKESNYKYVAPTKWISAGGVVVDGLTPEALQMVYLVRPAGSAFGKLTLPKGRGEEGESLETTAMREVAEEAGISARFLPDGYLGDFDGSSSKTNYYMMFRVKDTGKGHDDEIERVELMHIDEAIKQVGLASNWRDEKVLKLAKEKIQAILANMGR